MTFRIVDTKNRFSFWLDKFKSFEPVVDKIDTVNYSRYAPRNSKFNRRNQAATH